MESYLRKRGVRLAFLVLLVFAALALVYYLRDVFAPLIFAFLIAYILNPVVILLSNMHIGSIRFGRSSAVGLIFGTLLIAFIAMTVTGGYYFGRWVQYLYQDIRGEPRLTTEEEIAAARLAYQTEPLRDDARDIWYVDLDGDGKYWQGYARLASEKAAEWSERSELGKSVHTFIEEQTVRDDGWFNPDRLRKVARDYATAIFAPRTRESAAGPNDVVVESGGISLFAKLSWFLLCPVYLFFIMLRFDAMVDSVRRHLPGRSRPRIERVVGRIDRTVAGFLRGRLLVCLCKGVLTAIGLYALGVDNGILLGMLSGFLSLIPYVGILCSMIPALIFTWLEYSSWGRMAGVAGIYFSVEAIEGVVLIPGILGKEIGISPLTVLVTLFVFAKLFGFIGVLLSVPLAAISKILGEEFLMPLIREFANETSQPAKPPATGPPDLPPAA